MPGISFARADGGAQNVSPNLTVQATATALPAAVNNCVNVSASHYAVILPANPTSASGIVVHNSHASQAVSVFPPTGGAVNEGAANAAFSVAAGKTAVFYPAPDAFTYQGIDAGDPSGINYLAVLGA